MDEGLEKAWEDFADAGYKSQDHRGIFAAGWAARTPGPDVSRLLRAAKYALLSLDQGPEEDYELRDAIAEHEAARPDHIEPAEFGWTPSGCAARRESRRLAGESAQPE